MGFSIVGISYWNLCLISTNRNLAMYDPKLGKALSFSYLHTIQSRVLFMYFEKNEEKNVM